MIFASHKNLPDKTSVINNKNSKSLKKISAYFLEKSPTTP